MLINTPLLFVPERLINEKSADLDQVWLPEGNKPLSKPMMTKINDVSMTKRKTVVTPMR